MSTVIGQLTRVIWMNADVVHVVTEVAKLHFICLYIALILYCLVFTFICDFEINFIMKSGNFIMKYWQFYYEIWQFYYEIWQKIDSIVI
jgi:hypothetical protein